MHYERFYCISRIYYLYSHLVWLNYFSLLSQLQIYLFSIEVYLSFTRKIYIQQHESSQFRPLKLQQDQVMLPRSIWRANWFVHEISNESYFDICVSLLCVMCSQTEARWIDSASFQTLLHSFMSLTIISFVLISRNMPLLLLFFFLLLSYLTSCVFPIDNSNMGTVKSNVNKQNIR